MAFWCGRVDNRKLETRQVSARGAATTARRRRSRPRTRTTPPAPASRRPASTLSAGAGSITNDYASASIRIGLTEEGLLKYKDVLMSAFSYIELMKKNQRPEYIFDQLKSIASLEEVFSNKGEGMWRATDLANEVMMYPIEDVGRVNYIYENSNPKDYTELLSHINPENMLVTIAAKGVKVDKTEHFYQTKYSYSEDSSFYKQLIGVEVNDEFTLPEANPFIPKSASVPRREFKTDVFPELISEEKGHKLYLSYILQLSNFFIKSM